jgi:hypothetical protein
MSKKLYSVGFNKIEKYINKNYKFFNEPFNHKEDFNFYQIFGKSYYELAILNFFKEHTILKQHEHSLKLYDYFNSQQFIIQTMKYSGMLKILETKEKNNDSFLIWYFYCFVYVFYERCYDSDIERRIFEYNFLHFSTTISSATNININYEAMVKKLLAPKKPKESFGKTEEGVFFNIILDKQIVVSLKGSSIKTLRKKAYKILLKEYLE